MFKESILKMLKLDVLIENIRGYIETRIDLVKYEIKEDIVKGLSKLVMFAILALAAFLFLILISFAAAYALGEHFGWATGFLIVAGFYLLVILVLALYRQRIGNYCENQLMELLNKKK